MWKERFLELGKWTGLGALAGFAGGVLFGVVNSISISSLAINWATVFTFTSWMIFAGIAATGVLLGVYKAATIKQPGGVNNINNNELNKNIKEEKDIKSNEIKRGHSINQQNTLHNNDPPQNNLSSEKEGIIKTLFTKNEEDINNQTTNKVKETGGIQLF